MDHEIIWLRNGGDQFDPETGIGYAFGTHRGRDLALTVYRMELNGRLTKLGSEHLVFVVPPDHYDLPSLLSDQVAAADAYATWPPNPRA